MDIAFHYFAVKTLARLAGFAETDAQIIAENSQMVDDFDFTRYWNCSNVPRYIKNSEDYDLCVWGGYFNPAQTGFLCDGLLGYTDYVNLVRYRFQKFTCAPFHFIPPDRSMIGKEEYRVRPAKLGDGSIISQLLEQAMKEFRAAEGTKLRHRKLMKLGVLLHIFADTVAHHMFSGFNAYVNMTKLVQVTNNITKGDETKKYKSNTQKLLNHLTRWVPWFTPAIGHMMLEHVPDLTHLTFKMEYRDNNQVRTYERNNTEEFLDVSRQILDFLCDCLGTPRFVDTRWKDVRKMLNAVFQTDISEYKGQEETVKHLQKVWGAAFPYKYKYNGEALKAAFIGKNATAEPFAPADENGMKKISLNYLPSATDMKLSGMDMSFGGENDLLDSVLATKASHDFYEFNVIADEILIALYGPHPR